jgi:hypothetical protein
VRAAVLARVEADSARRASHPFAFFLGSSGVTSSAWGLAGVLAGLLLLTLTEPSPASSRVASYSDPSAQGGFDLLPDDVAMLADLSDPEALP